MARKRKHPEKKRKPPLAAGDRLGILKVINPDAGRKNGHRLALVKSTDCDSTCRDCHGKPKLVRADYLRSGRVVSCGKRKRQLRHEHLLLKKSRGYYTDLDTIDPETLRAALAEPGVDAATGEPIEKAEPKQALPVKPVIPTPAPVKVGEKLPPFSNKITSDELLHYGLVDAHGRWTEKGRAWRKAGQKHS
jgi:predicted SprT family Zn-dependent metalloprotease